MCTFQYTIEMYRAPVGQTTLVWVYRTPAVHSPATVFVPPAQQDTTGPVVGECRGKDKSCSDNASLIDSDSFQVSGRFPNLVRAIGKVLLMKFS